VPDNGKDDDGNGYVDDVHGIAHDRDGQRVVGLLKPVSLTAAELTEYRDFMKGRRDVRAGLQTPEADAVRRKLAAITPDEMRSLQEKFAEYAAYVHGTHVAGVAVRDNPAARMLVARLGSHSGNEVFRRPPRAPTLEHARVYAQNLRETVAYFRQHGVRVVNMSWGFAPARFESMLAANGVGTPEERRQLARQIYEIGATALHEAMLGAPETLFVAAAGNDDADNRFGESAPSTFDLPNLLTVGAVDQAGDEANFTSYGKVDVYANGVDVLARIPGGDEVPIGGTSNAAPQVANLAAKLLAVHPELTVALLREAILIGAEEKTVGPGKRIMLLHPAGSLEIAARLVGGGSDSP
jgi:subtilisin family serine protease